MRFALSLFLFGLLGFGPSVFAQDIDGNKNIVFARAGITFKGNGDTYENSMSECAAGMQLKVNRLTYFKPLNWVSLKGVLLIENSLPVDQALEDTASSEVLPYINVFKATLLKGKVLNRKDLATTDEQGKFKFTTTLKQDEKIFFTLLGFQTYVLKIKK